MEMICKAGLRADLGHGIWIADMDRDYLPFFGTPLMKGGNRTILALQSKPNISPDMKIEFDVKEAKVLMLGVNESVIVVYLATPELTADQAPENSDRQQRPVIETVPQAPKRRGDDAFISACKKEGMPMDVILLGQNFIKKLREFSNDELVEGKARKWVTAPNNFLAITIQNRKKTFAIHVRKTLVLEGLSTIDVRDDRPGYARFWLEDQGQLIDALTAAKASYRSG